MCDHPLMNQFAVVGCGHSGTYYTSEVFRRIGLDVPHETHVGRDGIVCWGYTHLQRTDFPSPPFAGQDIKEKYGLSEDALVFHQVRNPLKVISSVVAMKDVTWKAIGERAVSRGLDWNPLDDQHPIRGMKYWLIWNNFAEQIACFRYKVENMQFAFPILLDLIGLERVPLPDVPHNTNKHNYSHTYTWLELEAADKFLCDCVKTMSKLYGYATQD